VDQDLEHLTQHPIDRRAFLALLGLGTLGSPRAAEAQTPGRIYRLGILRPAVQGGAERIVLALRELGYVEGQNITVQQRYADGKLERLPALARELVQLRMDVLVVVGAAATRAAKAATSTIPLVMWGNFDPVAAGFVTSLARPGGNITGILIASEGTLAGKKLQLLKEAVPRATRFALLVPDDPNSRTQVQEVQKAAPSLGVELVVATVRGGDYDRAFAAMVAERSGALFVAATTYFMTDRKRIIELAAKHRLPAIYEWPDQVEDGGLMAYGSNLTALVGRVAGYVDQIFKGARPGDLPIEQPTTFELVINLKTARALGLTLPPALLARAGRVIE
jgi:putative ABC transport system substrate-binding protein